MAVAGLAARGAALALGALALGALAAACSSSAPPATSAPSGPTPSGAATSTAPSTSATTAITGAGALAHCLAPGLAGAVVGNEGAAGTIELTVALRNTGTAPCALQGYPGALLLDTNENQLPTDVVRGGSYSFTDFAATAVTIAAGQSAYVNIGFSDVMSGTTPCPAAASMWLTPPDDFGHLVLTQQMTVCNNGTLTVSPVFTAASPGSQTTAP